MTASVPWRDESSHPALALCGVSKRFGPTLALEGVDLEVRGGEVHGLVGENGAGKSTLLRILAGALPADRGTMQLGGSSYAPRSPAEGRRRGLATIYQELSLAPHLSVAENICLGALPRRGIWFDRAAARAKAESALARIGAASIDPAQRVASLGAAQRQLVEIARAVAFGSRAYVFDEPTSSLGRAECEQLFALIEDLRRSGAAVVYVSHALEEVDRLCDRVTVLRDGRKVASFERGDFDSADLVRAMAGRELESFERTPSEPGEVLLEVARRDGAGAALRVRRGEVVGIAGLVGAGRSEMLRALFGLDPVGPWRFSGPSAAGRSVPRERWRRGLGLVSEDRAGEGLCLARPLDENLCLPRLGGIAALGAYLAPSRLARAAARWTEQLGVKQRGLDLPVRTLSGGNQQKVAVARLLDADVELLLLDEPTRGVDVAAKAEIYRLVSDLAAGVGAGGARARGVLVVSSYLPELLALCDRIAVMRGGVLTEARAADELDEHELLQAAALGGGAA